MRDVVVKNVDAVMALTLRLEGNARWLECDVFVGVAHATSVKPTRLPA